MNDLGSSWYVNSSAEDIEVFEITPDMVTDKILKKYDKELSFCNLDKDALIDKFYDKDGWIYFKAEKYYRFELQIKEFRKKK
ncbi:MAG: hypothetical protein J5647_13610 [Spirochaetaceae bacterium]|nr:hypothetical protein [Spirochaetaceae bacterium]